MPRQAFTLEPDDDVNWSYQIRSGRDWRSPGFRQSDEHPVVCVSFDDVEAYLHWLNKKTYSDYRLPSESEWEYAARAGTTTPRYWDSSGEDMCLHANVADQTLMERINAGVDPARFASGSDGYAFTSPVGSFSPNKFGISDILGNVWEWCADRWHDDYNGAPVDGSAWVADNGDHRRVVRGGCWDYYPWGIRAGFRYPDLFDLRASTLGFRVAKFGDRKPF